MFLALPMRSRVLCACSFIASIADNFISIASLLILPISRISLIHYFSYSLEMRSKTIASISPQLHQKLQPIDLIA